MKPPRYSTKPFGILTLVFLALAAICIGIIPRPPSAEAQVVQTDTGLFTGLPLTVATNGVTATNSSAIDVRPGKTLAILPEFRHASGSLTGNVIFTVQVTADGTNYTTASGLTYTVAANGTSTVRGYWLLDPTELNSVRKVRLSTYSNAANAAVLTNILVRWSYGNQ